MAYRAIKRLWWLPLLLAIPVGAQVVKAINTVGVRMQPQASAPTNCGAGNPCVYYSSGTNTFRQIDNAGSESSIGSGGGAGTVTSISQGTAMSFSVNPIVSTGTINHANVGPGTGSCTLCSVTTDAQGHVTARSSGAEADTMQAVYDRGSDITTSSGQQAIAITAFSGQTTPIFDITRDAIANTFYDAIKLNNTSAAAGALSPQNSPGIFLGGRGFRTEAPTGDQPDQWRIRSNPFFDQSGDTAHLEFLHSYDATNFVDGVRFTLQDQFGLGELIIATVGLDSECLYPHAAPGDPHGLLAFLCLNGNQVKFGTALSGGNRIQFGASVGFAPQVDDSMDLGQYDNGVFLWRQFNSHRIRSHDDTVGTGAASANIELSVENNTAATSGNQKYSPSFALQGSGWDTNTSSSRQCEVDMQLVPIQETTAPPSIETRWTHRVEGIDTDVVDLVLATKGGGTLLAQHIGGRNTAPTFTAGAAADCTTAASGISFATGSTDTAGTLTFTTGTAVCPTGTIGTITFNKAYKNPPTVILYSANAAATVSDASARVFQANTTTTTFVMTQNTAGYQGATQFKYSYIVMGE